MKNDRLRLVCAASSRDESLLPLSSDRLMLGPLKERVAGEELDLVKHGPHMFVGGSPRKGKTNFLQHLLRNWFLNGESNAQVFLSGPGFQHWNGTRFLIHKRVFLTTTREGVQGVLESLAEIFTEEEEVRELQHQVCNVSRHEDVDARVRPPRLVIIIDEYMKFINEQPSKFLKNYAVTLMNGIISRGAKYGIHLVLASQDGSVGNGGVSSVIHSNTDIKVSFKTGTPKASRMMLGEGRNDAFLLRQPGDVVGYRGDNKIGAAGIGPDGKEGSAHIRVPLVDLEGLKRELKERCPLSGTIPPRPLPTVRPTTKNQSTDTFVYEGMRSGVAIGMAVRQGRGCPLIFRVRTVKREPNKKSVQFSWMNKFKDAGVGGDRAFQTMAVTATEVLTDRMNEWIAMTEGDVATRRIQGIAKGVITKAEANRAITQFKTFALQITLDEVARDVSGPSAGLASYMAVLSIGLGRRIIPGTCFTGELDSHGGILGIGALEAKIRGLYAEGFTRFVVPKANAGDLRNIDPQLLKMVTFVHDVEQCNEFLEP